MPMCRPSCQIGLEFLLAAGKAVGYAPPGLRQRAQRGEEVMVRVALVQEQGFAALQRQFAVAASKAWRCTAWGEKLRK